MSYLQLLENKIISRDKIKKTVSEYMCKNERIVFTNGCFDVIHRGHIEYLAQAANLGKRLIIGLNTDNSVKRLKGNDRPINDEYSRAIVLAALVFVDAIVLFEEDTPLNLITEVQPKVLVKGGDYKPENIVGYDIVKKNGGEVVTIDFVKGFSSTSIITKGTLV